MTSQSLARFLKSHWPAVIIAVAVLAFLAGAFTSNRGVADEPSPTVASNPAATPTIPPELYATPTKEEFAESVRVLRAKQAAAGNDGENRSGRSRVYMPTPTPRSTAEAAFFAAPDGRALYFPPSDKVIHLPEGVEVVRWISSGNCGVWCPYTPVLKIQKGEATVHLDARGDVISPLPAGADVDNPDADNPDAFPFLD